jgi:hypothetical protein
MVPHRTGAGAMGGASSTELKTMQKPAFNDIAVIDAEANADLGDNGIAEIDTETKAASGDKGGDRIDVRRASCDMQALLDVDGAEDAATKIQSIARSRSAKRATHAKKLQFCAIRIQLAARRKQAKRRLIDKKRAFLACVTSRRRGLLLLLLLIRHRRHRRHRRHLDLISRPSPRAQKWTPSAR